MSECDPACDAKGIPRHLHHCGRSVDSEFADNELLFRRFPANCQDLAAHISFDRMSVNREKYCESAEDTLWNDKAGGRYVGYGVFSLPVLALNFRVSHPDQPYAFTLRPQHQPEPCNYPHSEVVATKFYEDGSEEPLPEIKPKSIKHALRKAFRDSISIAVVATVG